MLNSKQRAYLRSLAVHIDTIFQIGKGGINENMTEQISNALEARELIKLRVLDNSEYSSREAAEEIAEIVNADVVQVVGTRFVLYRESKKHKKIELIK
jgi:RNA-binding protein